MKIPILKLQHTLLTALQVDLTDRDVVDLQEDLLIRISDEDITGVVIDVSALPSIDSYLSKVLTDTAEMVGALGARIVVCGIQPTVAMTILELQSGQTRFLTALNLEQGIDVLSLSDERSS